MSIPVFATLHLADLYRNPSDRELAKADWRRIRAYREGRWPARIPERLIVSNETNFQASLKALEAMSQAQYVAVDTEFYPDTQELWLLGVAAWWGDCITGVQTPWLNRDGIVERMRGMLATAFARLVMDVPVVMWNAKADIPVIEKAMDIPYTAYKQVDDPMQAHHVLWCEMEHSLEHAASIYGWYPKMKHMAKDDPYLYNWGDCIETVACWEALRGEMGYA